MMSPEMKVGRSTSLVEPGTTFHFTYAPLPISEMPIKIGKRFVVKYTQAECKSTEMDCHPRELILKVMHFMSWVFLKILTYKKIIKKTQCVDEYV